MMMMQIFDESLRVIPLGKNLKQIVRSILKEPSDRKERYNLPVGSKEITLALSSITIKVSKSKVKMIYSKKSVYEEIHFNRIDLAVYTDGMILLRDSSILHIIMLQ